MENKKRVLQYLTDLNKQIGEIPEEALRALIKKSGLTAELALQYAYVEKYVLPYTYTGEMLDIQVLTLDSDDFAKAA